MTARVPLPVNLVPLMWMAMARLYSRPEIRLRVELSVMQKGTVRCPA